MHFTVTPICHSDSESVRLSLNDSEEVMNTC